MADSWERFIVNIAETQQLYSEILTVRETCDQIARKTRDVGWVIVGQEVAKVQSQFATELDAAAKTTAVFAQKAIVTNLNARLVRPPTGNRPGLQNLIWCTPVSTGPFSFSQVEVAWVSKLDQAVNPLGGSKPSWRSQEFGYSGNIGRGIFGSFLGAGSSSVPSPLEFRQHPLFIPGAGGPGTISRPIPAKHFLRDGTDAAKVYWRGLIRDAVSRAISQLGRIQLPKIP